MQFLLDTHTFLWWATDAPELSQLARGIIEDGENKIFFSAASGWEIAIKTQIGRLSISDDLEPFIATQLHQNNFTVLPIQLSHTLHVSTFPLHHKDPFDRILIAQSSIEQIPILTIDPLISQYDVQTIWEHPPTSDEFSLDE